MISRLGPDAQECCEVAAKDWDDKGNAATMCPPDGVYCAFDRARFLGCPFQGFGSKGHGATLNCPGWYRRQPLFLDMMKAVRLKDAWCSCTPDDMPAPLQEFLFWYSVYESQSAVRSEDDGDRSTKT